ncbi:MAG TPA: phage holin family protein, partial [Thermomicrobiales bacterium]|nr:phage holin family protein [Thermomicrobiales bacterium]
PVITLFTLPITCVTFGLFALVINAALFGLAAWLTPGIEVTFWGAVISAVLVSIASGVIFSVVDEG